MMAKARVTTRRFVSISRLELFTAVLAVKISALIKKELEMKELTKYICTDIKIALGYIAKNKKVTIYFANENLHILDIILLSPANLLTMKSKVILTLPASHQPIFTVESVREQFNIL